MSTFLLRYIKLFFIADLAIVIAHVLLHDRSPIFDLDLENNIPTYFATAQVFLTALLMVEIHVTERKYFKRIVPGTWVWIILAAAFAYLAIDDVAAIHEYVLRHTARDLLPPDSLWISLMPWQIIFEPLFALIAALLVMIMLTRFIKGQDAVATCRCCSRLLDFCSPHGGLGKTCLYGTRLVRRKRGH